MFLSSRIELNCCIRGQKKRPSERKNVVIRYVLEEGVKSYSDLVQDIISHIGVERFEVKYVTRLGKPFKNEQGVLNLDPSD